VSLKIDKEKMDKLYALEKHGVPRTHLECLMWFHVNTGKIVDIDTLKGKRVPGRTDTGFPFQARYPIPANKIVSKPHYLHSGIRGSYKPAGEEIVGYDDENRKAIWEGEDKFVQAIQTGEDGTLEGYDKEIEFDGNGNWSKIKYDHLPDRDYYEITGGYLQRCYANKIPLGIIFKQADEQKKILGLGLITEISKNKLNYTIEPYDWNSKMDSQFQFVKKDFDATGSIAKKKAKYRHQRFKDLASVIENNYGQYFYNYKSYVGFPFNQGSKKYYPYSWLGIYSDDTRPKDHQYQFQIALHTLNEKKELTAGLWLDGKANDVRKKLCNTLPRQKDEALQMIKKLPLGYLVASMPRKGDRTFTKVEDLENLDKIIEDLAQKGTELKIYRSFNQAEALDLKTDIIGEFSETFDNLVPLHRLLTGETTADLDPLVDAWIQKLAKSTEYNPDSKPLEEWCDNFARGEIQNRYDTLPNIVSAIGSFEMGNSSPADLLKAFSKNDVLRDNYLYQKLGKPGLFTENPEAKKIIDEIIQHNPVWQKPEDATGNVMNAMKSLADVKLSGGQVFQPHFAKVLISAVLSSMRPDLFVDYRKNRWNELAKQIGTSFMEDGEKDGVIAAAELAQSITKTNSFKKYFGGKYKDASGNEHLLWVLAGIAWVIRGGLDNVDENLSDVADKILLGDPENGKPEIAVEKDVVLRILRHLESGKHVILVGAPGVGKTMLSKRILDIYGMKKTSKEYVKSVATAEWSRYHVIGGLNLEGKWNRGKVSEAAEEGKWLLIDEFNRADINKAFGELFLGIEDGEITLSEVEMKAREEKLKKEKREPETKITIPKTFRMIGTMNDYDKNLLLTELSYGLITRFAFVDIKPDGGKEEESVKKQIIEMNEAITEKDWDSCSKEIKDFFEFNKKVREWRMIGVRTTIDVIRYMISASKDTNKKKLDYLDEALCDYLLPQFDRLDGKTIEETEKASQKMNAKGFTEGLTKMRKDLEAKSNIWNEQ